MANLTNINNKFLVTTGGDVGIGTTSPSEKLSVNGNISLNRYLSLSNSDYTYILGKRTSPSDGFYLTRLMGYGDNTFYGSFDVLRHDADDGELRFRTRTTGVITDVMTIVDGNVGINETSPDALLDIEMTDTNTYDANAINTATLIAQTFNTSNVNNQASIISLRTTGWAGSTTGVVNIGAVQASGNASSADFVIQTRNAGTYGERMRIDSRGNTTHIASYASNTFPFRVGYGSYSSFTPTFVIDDNGDVGIGTTSPSSKLTVIDGNNTFETSDGNNYARSTVNGGSVQLGLFRAGSNIGGGYLGADGQTCFHVRDASFATKLYLTQAGSLGIGTTSPTKTLQVNGSIGLTTTATDGNKRIHTYPDDYHSWYYKSSVVNNQSADVMTYYQQFLIRHQDSTDVFIIRGNGNVGIGTTSPNPFGWGNKHLTVLAAGANQYAAVDIIGSGNAAGAILFGGGSGSGTATNIGRAQISAHDGSHLVFATNESNSGSSFTERMRIPNSGGLDMSSGIPTGTHDNMTTFKTSKFTVTSGNSDTATLVPKSAGMSSTGTVYVALENSGNTVRWGYIIDFFYNNSTLNSTIRESGSSQGTTTASITEVNGDIKLTIAYAGGLGGSIRYIAGGHSVNMSWSA